MKDFRKPIAQARRRLRRTAENLVGDSSLRSNLTDAQAKQLLDWGIDLIQRESLETADLDDSYALPRLEEKITATRRVMREVNRLMESPGQFAERDNAARLSRLLESLGRLTDGQVGPGQHRRAQIFSRHSPDLDSDTSFQLLMALLKPQDDLGQEEE